MQLFSKNQIINRAEFESYIQNQVIPQLQPIEVERKRKLLLYVCLPFAIFVLLTLSLSLAGVVARASSMLIAGYLSTWIIIAAICTRAIYSFFMEQKEKLFPTLLKQMGSLSNGQTVINEAFIQKSELFGVFDYFDIDDAFSGTCDKTDFSVAETILRSEKRGTNHVIFSGIMIAVPMPRCEGHTVVFNVSKEEATYIKMPGYDKIEISNPSFMKEHIVYTKNKTETYELLSKDMIDRMNDMKKVFQTNAVHVSFFDGYALFALETYKNLFEPFRLFYPVIREKTYIKFYEQIETICELIDELSEQDKK